MATIYQNIVVLNLRLHRRLFSSNTRRELKENLIASAYTPSAVEKDKFDKWERNESFKVDNKSEKPSFSLVLPPPNVTGKLHLGKYWF